MINARKIFFISDFKTGNCTGWWMSRAIDIYGDFYRMFRESPGMCRIGFSMPSQTNVDFFPMCVTTKAENGPLGLELEMAFPHQSR